MILGILLDLLHIDSNDFCNVGLFGEQKIADRVVSVYIGTSILAETGKFCFVKGLSLLPLIFHRRNGSACVKLHQICVPWQQCVLVGVKQAL